MTNIFKRKSIRTFIDKPVEKEKLERLLRAAMQAPSARNGQPWEFLVLTEKENLRAVADMTPYGKMTASAGAAIVVLGRVSPGEVGLNRWTVQDLSAATENILLQIVDEGLGGVWLGWHPDEERVEALRKKFQVPENLVPFSVIALGYSNDENVGTDRFQPERIHYEKI